jgi:aspartate/methionine/tyrosine aminotransferase
VTATLLAYVPPTPHTLARPLAKRLATLPPAAQKYDLASDIPDAVIEAAMVALKRGETHYTDRPGILDLRSLIASRLNDSYDIGLSPKDVTITCGSTEARFVSLKLLATPGSVVICNIEPNPIMGTVRLVGARTLMTDSELSKLSVAYLAPTADPRLDRQHVELAAARNAYIIWDMSIPTLPSTFHPAQLPELRAKVVTIGGLWREMPGWRVGWVAGSDVAEKLRALKQSLTICATAVSQWAAVAMLNQEG